MKISGKGWWWVKVMFILVMGPLIIPRSKPQGQGEVRQAGLRPGVLFLCYVINVMLWGHRREKDRPLSLHEKWFKSCLWLASADFVQLPAPWIIHEGLILKLVICFIAKAEFQNALAPNNDSSRGFLMPWSDSGTEPQKNSPSHLVFSRRCLVNISGAH